MIQLSIAGQVDRHLAIIANSDKVLKGLANTPRCLSR